MRSKETNPDKMFQPIEDAALLKALNTLGRSVNIVSTYGIDHPAFQQAVDATVSAMGELFRTRKKILIGAFNGAMTVDEVPVATVGILQKSLERRLNCLRITGLRITRGISKNELTKIAELLASTKAEKFKAGLNQAGLQNAEFKETRFEAVHEGETVANELELIGKSEGNGVLVLDDSECGKGDGATEPSVHVDQIVAFLKGDINIEDGNTGEELSDLASTPEHLAQMIMESVAIRQSASQLSGESLGDIVLGCLRRTYDGLRKQPAFQSTQGAADLQKALLLLEENMLEKMRGIAGDSNPELDRQIVQAIREMNEDIGFQLAANQYIEHREAIEENKHQLESYVQAKGATAAEELISGTNFPSAEWRRIIVENRNGEGKQTAPSIMDSLNTLTMVFEKLENVMKSSENDETRVQDLLGQANDNLEGTTHSTKKKLDSLSEQLYTIEDEDTGTIDNHAQMMNRKELLSSIAEIAQELMQPLTAINASVEMLLSGYVGEVTPDQRNLLSLANSSGDDLNYLMKELIEIVGIPTNRGVDKRFSVPHK
ncbi:MAG: hypothetical protein ABFR47_05345 [Verrucomicrobiota bacterium]